MLDNTRNLPVVGALKLVGIGLLPLTIYEFAKGILSGFKSSLNEKIDAAFGAIVSLGSIGDVIADTAEGLSAVGAVEVSSVAWATPLAIASAVIQSLGLVLTVKNMIESRRFTATFVKTAALYKPVREYSLRDYKNVQRLLRHRVADEKSFIDKHFKTDSGKLLERLEAIKLEAKALMASGNFADVLKGKRKLHSTMHKLKGRITLIKRSHYSNFLASFMGLVGFGLLFSPCPPSGLLLVALSSVLSIRNFFSDKVQTSLFERSLENKELNVR
jgi:hypothetical protein